MIEVFRGVFVGILTLGIFDRRKAPETDADVAKNQQQAGKFNDI